MHPLPAPLEETPLDAPPAALRVETRMVFSAAPPQVWEQLLFYEQIVDAPPLHLRLLLPVPIQTIGAKSQVGDEARCLYRGGHLVKRVTAIDPGRTYTFSVVEQAMDVGGGMVLRGGEYSLRPLDPARTEVSVATRYVSTRWPRLVWGRVEAAVCHSFHRHLLRSIRRAVEAR